LLIGSCLEGYQGHISDYAAAPACLLIPVNDCYATLDAAGANKILNGDFSTATNDMCMGMHTLWSEGVWSNSQATQSDFSKYSANTAINLSNGRWQQQTTDNYLNWCSGFNLHFDMALPMMCDQSRGTTTSLHTSGKH